MDRDIPCSQFGSTGGFHVTQVSLIITQVKNKIAYHVISWVKKLKYRRGVINQQRAKVPAEKKNTDTRRTFLLTTFQLNSLLRLL